MTRRPQRHWHWALALAAALLAAQWLGLVHRVAHANGPLSSFASTAWFDDHDEPDCRLFDQAAHGDLLVGAAVAASVIPPAPLHGEPHAAARIAQQAAGALARGPPRIG